MRRQIHFTIALLLSLITPAPALADAWDSYFCRSISKVSAIKMPGLDCEIAVVLEHDKSGHYKILGLGSTALPHPQAERVVRDIVQPALGNIVEHPQHFRYVYFIVAFKPGKTTTVSGPFYRNAFAVKGDDDLLFATGLKKKTYEKCIEAKLKATDLSVYAGYPINQVIRTRSQFKLTPDGHVHSININAPDETAKQTVYQLISKNQPYGKMPDAYKSKPDFLVSWSWQRDGGSSSPGFQRIQVRHLDY